MVGTPGRDGKNRAEHCIEQANISVSIFRERQTKADACRNPSAEQSNQSLFVRFSRSEPQIFHCANARLELPDPRLSHLGLRRRILLQRGDVQAGNSKAAVTLKPHDNPAPLRIGAGMIGASHAIPIAAACDDGERLEWTSQQKLSNVSNHLRLTRPHQSKNHVTYFGGMLAIKKNKTSQPNAIKHAWRRCTAKPSRSGRKKRSNNQSGPATNMP